MKITKIEALHVGQFMFARVSTDEGIVGYGEAGTWGHIEAAGACIRRFAEYLEGKDAFAIEHHWNVMHRFSYFQGLAENAAISARRGPGQRSARAPMNVSATAAASLCGSRLSTAR